MKTAKEWADALIAARPSMTAGQDPVDFADAFAGIIETIQRDAIESVTKGEEPIEYPLQVCRLCTALHSEHNDTDSCYRGGPRHDWRDDYSSTHTEGKK